LFGELTASHGTAAAVDLRVVDIDPTHDARWDEFVTAHADGLVFHHSAWLRTLESEYDHGSVALAAEDAQGRLHGVLPLAYTRGLPFRLGGPAAGRRLASLPRTPVAGPLGTSRAGLVAVVGSAVERVRAEPGLRLQIKTPSRELDGVEQLVGKPWRLNYLLELPPDPSDLRFGNARNHGRIRWAVNKATRSGLHVRPAESEEELRAWYRLYLDVNRTRLQPPRSYRLFEAAWRLLRPLGLMRLLLAEQRTGATSRIVAGSMLFMLGGTVFYAFNGRLREALSLRPNDVIQWHAIHQACAEGFRRYDFGEVAEANVDLAKFKSKWGTEAHRLHRYYYPAPPEGGAGYGSLESENLLRRAAKPIWHVVPFRLTEMLGDRVYRYL
jgi:CelD/BcsL family acetyltransferase involved in cellulose biosynthesis